MATKSAIKSTHNSTTIKHSATQIAEKRRKYMPTAYKSITKVLKERPIIGALIAEFLAAFILTAVFVETQGNPLYIAFTLIGVVLFTGSLSGANPAMTIGAWATRKISWLRAIGYIVVQLLGATVAYLVLNAFLHANDPTSAQLAAGSTAPSLIHAADIIKDKEWYLFFVELLGATILALGIASAVRTKRHKVTSAFAAGFALLSALAIALTLCSGLSQLLTESNVIQTFLNPAIAFAANGLSWNIWPVVIYVIAPIIGGVIGFIVQDMINCSHDKNCDCDTCR